MIDNTTQLAIESASIISSHCQKLQDLEHRVRSSFAEMAQLQPGIDDSSSRALELCMNNTVWSLLNFVKRRQRTFEPLDISTVAQECERIESFMQMLESEATISVISSDKWRNVVRETLTHIADSVHVSLARQRSACLPVVFCTKFSTSFCRCTRQYPVSRVTVERSLAPALLRLSFI